eukprot:FR743278.1.p2 GENE.FR743278.1~~FR743278.1.p2  ORF type:complete len:101 (-),score=31.43 FR743278.1:581-883(-)
MTQDYAKGAIYPSIKGKKGGVPPGGRAALELVDPLGSGPWLSLTAAAFFFFFFFFFLPVYIYGLPRRAIDQTSPANPSPASNKTSLIDLPSIHTLVFVGA